MSIIEVDATIAIWALSRIPCSRNGRLHEKKTRSRNFRGTIAVHVSENSLVQREKKKEREREIERQTDKQSERVGKTEREGERERERQSEIVKG